MPGDPQLLAFALKIGLTATIVVAAATATERAGPLLGALIVTLPIGAGPSYVFLALQHEPEFIAASALGSLGVNALNGVFSLVYAALAQRRGLFVSVATALAVWIILAAALRSVEWTLARGVLPQRRGLCRVFAACRARRRHADLSPPLVRRATARDWCCGSFPAWPGIYACGLCGGA